MSEAHTPTLPESKLAAANGFLGLFVGFALLGVFTASVLVGANDLAPPAPGMKAVVAITALVSLFTSILSFAGLFVVAPNEARVVTLFGRYVGSVRDPGFFWTNPFTNRRPISLRVRNFETNRLKVNDADGNPIEIGAVVVWRVVDTAEAVFEVEDFEKFVHVQSEAALRSLASHYAYDAHDSGRQSLSTHQDEVAAALMTAVRARLAKAGVDVLEARISHLAYAPEIAAAMLQRQQASAVVAARQQIVEGAVGMVDHALQMLSKQQIVELDDERKAAMVSNLLVVLCSDRAAHPVVNTGTLY
jgi:regulator of protease activity HflC (stomatin/prohibitin superfamily)